MIRTVLAVYDDKAKLFGEPIVAVAIGVVLREFADHVSDGKSQYSKHPEDYTLFEIGKYDDVKGEILPIVPRSVGNGLTLRTNSGPELVKEG